MIPEQRERLAQYLLEAFIAKYPDHPPEWYTERIRLRDLKP